MELIKFDAQTGRFQVGQDAAASLRAVKGPVGVVAVCGRARQGKSFILNQLLASSGGFAHTDPARRSVEDSLDDRFWFGARLNMPH